MMIAMMTMMIIYYAQNPQKDQNQSRLLKKMKIEH